MRPMPAPAIKICGVTTPEALDAVIAARADHVGFVFFPRSPRNLAPGAAAALAARAEGRVARVGLFVDADDAAIGEAVRAARLDGWQLHWGESPERAGQLRARCGLRARFGLPVWQAESVGSAGDVDRAAAYVGAVNLVVFDAKTPNGTLPGGMG